MEPPSGDGGDMSYPSNTIPVAPASMEPPSGDGGDARAETALRAYWMLQWSRRRVTAETTRYSECRP